MNFQVSDIAMIKYRNIINSSLRVLCALRCLGGDKWIGFGDLGRGMSSALVGGGYGWDGCVVCFLGGVFSWGD
jgi:hypothetical protein